MKSRPILFSGPMVRAILSGSKTQTRRVVTSWSRCLDLDDAEDRGKAVAQCPYGEPGDRLWVRETWKPGTDGEVSGTTYRADGAKRHIEKSQKAADRWLDARRPNEQWPDLESPKWRPSVHMPRWASRITLEVTDVRVERVQEISEADAKAEGASFHDGHGVGHSGWRHDFGDVYGDARSSFAALWDSINAARGFGWDSNPFVWAVSFRRVEE